MKKNVQKTFALGFNVDFSEDSEPMDELGVRAGPLGAVVAAPVSEVDDAELPGRPREFLGSVSTCTLPDLSSKSSPELVFSTTFVFTSEVVAVIKDILAFSVPLRLAFHDDRKSTNTHVNNE